MKNLDIIIKRWKSETPALFKKLIRISFALGIVAGSILGGDAAYGPIVPAIVITVCKYVMVACGSSGIISKLTTTDHHLSSDEKREENV